MGISNIVVPNKGDKIYGNFGIYILQNRLGCGGNGAVFEISIADQKDELPYSEEGYVVKILNLSAIKNEENREKRRERFQREVKAVRQIGSKQFDIIPILDSYMDVNTFVYEWYMMPRAKEYKFNGGSKPIVRLKHLRILGNTLLGLHQKGIFHRDIKPANLLYYKNRCCLTDFGLVWTVEQNTHITTENEAIGPVGIRPPEMEYKADKLRQDMDPQKVDVYLFAKTIWIILTGNYNGFRGEYRRDDPMICLNKNQLQLGESIQPLHKMMEKATVYSNLERITVEECLEYIDQQIKIAEGVCASNILEALKYDEGIDEVRNQIISDASVFRKPTKIQSALSRLGGITELIVNDFGEEISLGRLNEIDLVESDIFRISLKNEFAHGCMPRIRKVYLRIQQICITDEHICEINSEKFVSGMKSNVIVHTIKELVNNPELEVILDGQYLIVLKRLTR